MDQKYLWKIRWTTSFEDILVNPMLLCIRQRHGIFNQQNIYKIARQQQKWVPIQARYCCHPNDIAPHVRVRFSSLSIALSSSSNKWQKNEKTQQSVVLSFWWSAFIEEATHWLFMCVRVCVRASVCLLAQSCTRLHHSRFASLCVCYYLC